MTGRKTKCTPETCGVILRSLQRVRWLSHAAAMAGVHERTVRTWIARGEAAIAAAESDDEPMPESETVYAEFCLKVRAVQADMTGELVEMIATAAPDDWKAAAWLLERQDPRHWGKQAAEVHVSVEQPQHRPVIDLRDVPSERLRERALALSEGAE